MAHMLEQLEDGTVSMAWSSNGNVPWHGLGTKVEPGLSPKEFQIVAGLDWRVEEVESFVEFNGKKVPTGQKALVRDVDSKVLTQVGKGWHPVQNDKAFEFFSEFVEAGDMEMHTAGSLRDGKVIWALAKVKEDFTVFGDDKVESFMLFSNPHEYGKSVNVQFTPIRVVCNNTLTLALNSKAENGVKLNHRREFDPEMVKQMLGVASHKLTDYKEAAEYLGSKQANEATMIKYFGELLGTSTIKGKELSRNSQRALELVESQPGAEFAPNTMWSLFNAATYMVDHELGRSADTRMHSSWFGHGKKLKVEALNKAVEFADAI